MDKGEVIFASSTWKDDRLGEVLLKGGKINLEQYEESVRVLKMTGKKQGTILVELGYLTPKELFWCNAPGKGDNLYSFSFGICRV